MNLSLFQRAQLKIQNSYHLFEWAVGWMKTIFGSNFGQLFTHSSGFKTLQLNDANRPITVNNIGSFVKAIGLEYCTGNWLHLWRKSNQSWKWKYDSDALSFRTRCDWCWNKFPERISEWGSCHRIAHKIWEKFNFLDFRSVQSVMKCHIRCSINKKFSHEFSNENYFRMTCSTRSCE